MNRMVQKKKPEIFQGTKASKLNIAMLKVLYENGCLSKWEIAKKIVASNPGRAKKNWYYETQKVNSLLVRKNGRLSDLLRKGFIQEEEKGYTLTFNKGFCSALVFYDKIPKPVIDDTMKVFHVFPELKRLVNLSRKYFPEEAELEDHRKMREITMKLLAKGLNLELISNKEFNEYFLIEQEGAYLKKIEEKQHGKKNSWLSIPELNEAVMEFLSHLGEIAERQLKEYNLLKEKYRASSISNL
jgi:ribosomal protein S8